MALAPSYTTRKRRNLNREEQVTIPQPTPTLDGLMASVLAIKEMVEVLAAQRGDPRDTAVTWRQLLELGIVTPHDVPVDIGSDNMQSTRGSWYGGT